MPTVGEIPQLLEAQLRAMIAAPAGATVLALGLVLVVLAALRIAIGVVRFVYAYWLRPGRNLKRYGAWAVVTGATDGIGKAYCKQLARKGETCRKVHASLCEKVGAEQLIGWPPSAEGRRSRLHLVPSLPQLTPPPPPAAGLNLVLISRTESKLQDCAAELRGKYGVEARICPADLCNATSETFAKIGAALEGLEARRRLAACAWVLGACMVAESWHACSPLALALAACTGSCADPLAGSLPASAPHCPLIHRPSHSSPTSPSPSPDRCAGGHPCEQRGLVVRPPRVPC